jgi:hypothetical protein
VIATGIGLLHGHRWARRVLYPLLTGYTLLSVSVSAMAVVMLTRDDPDSSLALAAGFGLFTLALLALVTALYRPLRMQPGLTDRDPHQLGRRQGGHRRERHHGPGRGVRLQSERPPAA